MMFDRSFHPGKFKLLCSNSRCIRRVIQPNGFIEEHRERMIHYRTETFGPLRLMLLRAINESYYQVEQGNHHTYYCPACFEVKRIIEWRGDIVDMYVEDFDELHIS
jgi:hypothetical protein